MLALTRKKGESIIISDNIEVVILGVGSEQVKVGITAPSEISIYRKEIYEQIQQQNEQAALSNTDLDILKNLMK